MIPYFLLSFLNNSSLFIFYLLNEWLFLIQSRPSLLFVLFFILSSYLNTIFDNNFMKSSLPEIFRKNSFLHYKPEKQNPLFSIYLKENTFRGKN